MRLLLITLFLFLLTACNEDIMTGESGDPAADTSAFSSSSTGTGAPSGGGSGGVPTPPDRSGLITAGEWRDLENWDFWQELMGRDTLTELMDTWNMPLGYRVSVDVTDRDRQPLRDAAVELHGQNGPVATARTNHAGRAELFVNVSPNFLRLVVDGVPQHDARISAAGVVNVHLTETVNHSRHVELAFIVDATGSMGDELTFLKDDLKDIIGTVHRNTSVLDIATAAVFYRDEGDDYVTRHSPFTSTLTNTTSFISQQDAGGGGDFPEAVHTALEVALHDLRWSDRARAKIAFLLLDAPPHSELRVVDRYRKLVNEAAERGVRIVPVVASGIDKSTELLMRLTAIKTNGTYVFITDDSGIGNPHLEPTVGEFEVELLNELMVRLITEWVE